MSITLLKKMRGPITFDLVNFFVVEWCSNFNLYICMNLHLLEKQLFKILHQIKTAAYFIHFYSNKDVHLNHYISLSNLPKMSYLMFSRKGVDYMSRCLMAFSPLWLRYQLHATIKFEHYHRRDGDTIFEARSSRTVQRGEQYLNC